MSTDTKPKGLSVFFPAFNEEDNLGPLVEDTLRVLPQLADPFEIIIVNDGSSDGTLRVAEELARAHPQVRVVNHPHNLGYGAALRTGFSQARYDLIFFTDADNQFKMDAISRFLPHADHNDLVVGYRIKRMDPFHRLFIARTYRLIVSTLFGLKVRDIDCAYKLINKRVFEKIQLRSDGAFISSELLIRAKKAGFSIHEVGVEHFPRAQGVSKGATPGVIFKTLSEIMKLNRELNST